jgi:hypothetical protein
MKQYKDCSPEYKRLVKRQLPRYFWQIIPGAESGEVPVGFIFRVAAPAPQLNIRATAGGCASADNHLEHYTLQYQGGGSWKDVTPY